jgi:hypothetical protein
MGAKVIQDDPSRRYQEQKGASLMPCVCYNRTPGRKKEAQVGTKQDSVRNEKTWYLKNPTRETIIEN